MSACIWIHFSRPRPHWYELSDVDQAAKRAGWQSVAAETIDAGGEWVGSWHVRGQHDFETVEIWRFQTAEDAFAHWSRLTEYDYHRWFAFTNSVGTDTADAAVFRPAAS